MRCVPSGRRCCDLQSVCSCLTQLWLLLSSTEVILYRWQEHFSFICCCERDPKCHWSEWMDGWCHGPERLKEKASDFDFDPDGTVSSDSFACWLHPDVQEETWPPGGAAAPVRHGCPGTTEAGWYVTSVTRAQSSEETAVHVLSDRLCWCIPWWRLVKGASSSFSRVLTIWWRNSRRLLNNLLKDRHGYRPGK